MCREQVTFVKASPGDDSVDGDIDDQRIQRAQFTGYNFPPFHAWRDRNLLYDRDRRARCGDFHSIKWYKENRRVFVYSPVVDFSKAEGELLERSRLALDAQVYIKYIIYILLFLDAQEAKLTIDPILTTDEGEYKCEITFLDISKNCPVVQLVKLTTLAR